MLEISPGLPSYVTFGLSVYSVETEEVMPVAILCY